MTLNAFPLLKNLATSGAVRETAKCGSGIVRLDGPMITLNGCVNNGKKWKLQFCSR